MSIRIISPGNGLPDNPVLLRYVYAVGSIFALCSLILGVSEIGITFSPDGNAKTETVVQWFVLFNRNLGLVNLLMMAGGAHGICLVYSGGIRISKTQKDAEKRRRRVI